MIGIEQVYTLAGLMFAGFAVQHLKDRANPQRWKSALFWGCYATTFLAGSHLPAFANGMLVLVMVLLAGFGGLRPGTSVTTSEEQRSLGARKWGNRLFLPALIIPAVAVLGTLFLKGVTIGGRPVIDPAQVTLISLALGVIIALVAAFALLRPAIWTPIVEGRRLVDSVGWAAVLPQMLAALGALFALSGVGKVVAEIVTTYIPMTNGIEALVTYALGMVVFTMIMGNAFAAFPVMTAGIGLPVVVHHFHGDPIAMSAIGMLSGFCGTLLTPMAANYNIVPVALLELTDRWAVIRVQAATGVLILLCNIILMSFVVFS